MLKSCVTHGDTIGGKVAPEYITWSAMIARCYNPKNSSYARYGALGITVCDQWRNSYKAFLGDMGRRPSPYHSIDRIDSKGNYEPSNCRWATDAEQVRNRSQILNLSIDGVTRCAADWAEIVGISRYTIYTRLQRGFTAKEAVFGRPSRVCKLTGGQILEIQQHLAVGVQGKELAVQYNVARSTITRIKHLGREDDRTASVARSLLESASELEEMEFAR